MTANDLIGHYAVIFISQRSDGDNGYSATAELMVKLAAEQDGYLGIASSRNADGLGITVSYWRDLDAIKRWREHVDHSIARERGRREWYRDYHLQIAKIERAYDYSR